MSTSESTPQYVMIELPEEGELPGVWCPICGTQVMRFSEDEQGEMTSCPHLAFIHVGASGDFAHQSEDFARRLEEAEFDSLESGDIAEILRAAGYGNKLIAMEASYGGVSCGPVWFTDTFGFDCGIIAH